MSHRNSARPDASWHSNSSVKRRQILLAGAGALTVALAGCTGNNDDDDNGPPDPADDPEGFIDFYLDDFDANLYDGTFEDLTGQETVTMEYGTNGPDWATEPPAARISTGTTVTWEWVSDGHSLEQEDGTVNFVEETGVEDEGHTHEFTFDEAGVLVYFCRPHRGVGHWGGLIIEE